MLPGESAKQEGIFGKTYRTGRHQGWESPAKQAGIGEERLEQTQIELFNECPTEEGALTLHND